MATIKTVGLAMALTVFAEPLWAQTAVPPQQPNPQKTIPEKIEPNSDANNAPDAPAAADENLTEQLKENDGVIRPPENIDPEMEVPAPDTGTTPIIPPSEIGPQMPDETPPQD
jgi:hypothetical protein